MLFRNGKPRPSAARRRGAYRPAGENLEPRELLAGVDLINVAGTVNGGPFGVELVGTGSGVTQNAGAGFSVADVGDVSGDGFDDFVIGAPSIRIPTTTVGNTASIYLLGNGSQGSQAFLVFGSSSITGTSNPGTVNRRDWLTLTSPERIGDLSQVGSLNQANPLDPTNVVKPSFNGLILTTNNANSALGASAAGVGFGFLIGAPNGGPNNGGAAYLVYASSLLQTRAASSNTTSGNVLNLDAPNNISVREFTNANAPNSRTGYSVTSVGTFTGNGGAIAIGAPNASVNQLTFNGAVYVVPASLTSNVPAAPGPSGTPTVTDLSLVGQAGGVGGFIFSGAHGGDEAGFSVATAGSTTGSNTADLLIGAPAFNPFVTNAASGPGTAYLIKGGTNLTGALVTPSSGLATIPLTNVGGTGTNAVPGAAFTGDVVGDLTGWSVSSAGDFNGDGLADILIGSPGFVLGTGRANLIYGSSATTAAAGALTGVIPLTSLNTTAAGSTASPIKSVEFDGAAAGDLVGWSVSATRATNGATVNGRQVSDALVGAPGVQGSSGAVYLIPAQASLLGVQSLSNAQNAPIFATVITNSSFAPNVPTPPFNFLGSSVSGRPFPTSNAPTADSDALGDFIVGSPGLSVSGTAGLRAGGAAILEGRFVPLATPTQATIAPLIGVNAPGGAGPFPVNATSATITVHIDSIAATTTTPAFSPLTDINPAAVTITVGANTFTFNNVTLSPTNPVDENNDGIPDALITIPTSALNLANGTFSLSLSGTTLATAAIPNAQFTGTTSITVTGSSNNGGGGGGGLPTATIVSPTFGFPPSNLAGSTIGERLVPQPQTFSQIRWKHIPLQAGVNEFLPSAGFRERHNQIFQKTTHGGHIKKSDDYYHGRGVTTLGYHVFNRGRSKHP